MEEHPKPDFPKALEPSDPRTSAGTLRESARRFARAVTFLGALAAFSRVPAAHIPEEIHQEIEHTGRACALVVLEDPCPRFWPLEARCAAYRETQKRFLARLARGTFKVRHRYRFSPALLLELSPAALGALRKTPGVRAVACDLSGRGGLNESRKLIGADTVYEDLGIGGAGRVVAVLDTGVAPNNPDLEEAVIHRYHFLDQGADTGPGADDGHGHGTNVAGIVASRGTTAPRGVAPLASLVIVKVLNDSNRGWVSDWTAGVEYVVDLHLADNGIRVDAINMSLVTDAQYQGLCDAESFAFSSACRAAVEAGIAVFAASGNRGSIERLTAPACFSSTVAVGAVADSLPDAICGFTSRNEYLDLLAPGKWITSTGLNGTSTFQGTSQATPHAAAAAALLREIAPDLSPGEIRTLLLSNGVPVLDEETGLIFPRLDVLTSVRAAALPQVVDLACNDGGPLAITAEWSLAGGQGTGAAAAIEVTVRDETGIVARILLGSGSSSASVGLPQEGEYEICVQPLGLGGASGLTACCRTTVSGPAPAFRRGDCNGDGAYDVSDPLKTLLALFTADTGPIPCLQACDANDSGDLDLSDAIFSLQALFLGGPEPAAPYPGCGIDPTPDVLSCAVPSCME